MNPGIRTLFSLGGGLAVSVGSIGLGFLAPLPVNAASFTITLPEYSYDGNSPFPNASQLVGTFNYLIPSNDQIVSASLSGTFGNSIVSNSAAVDVYLDSLQVAKCLFQSTCWTSGVPTPWSYVFAPGDLSLLADGTANLTSIQTSEAITRLGPTTLTIETASTSASVPGPLPALGAAAAFGFSRKLRKRINSSKLPEVMSAFD